MLGGAWGIIQKGVIREVISKMVVYFEQLKEIKE